MAHNKTTNLPGSNDKQPGSDNNRNYNARDTSGQTPNMARTRSNQNKSKQDTGGKGHSNTLNDSDPGN